ncbi:hypothetical protein ACG04Q_05955 [Roseateles sp. DXS20W]|uniref:Sel1 repeat family protein n=1 Tax=Pelomonas lactea TaxID=3299030 RepID=A0ABW7GGN7_9BURK
MRRFVVPALALLGVVAVAGLRNTDRAVDEAPVSAERGTAEPLSPESVASAVAAASAAQMAGAADTTPPSKAAEVSRLVRMGTPADAWAAYQLLAACVRARKIAEQLPTTPPGITRTWMRKEPKPGVVCGDISPGQIASRASYLEPAAKAGLAGAAMAFLREGPTGQPELDMDAAPDSPGVAEWMQRSRSYVRQAAENGEREAIFNMSNFHQFTAPDHAQALRYFAAYVELTRDSTAPRPGRDITDAQTFALLKQGLTDPQIAEAMASGKQLAERVQQRR